MGAVSGHIAELGERANPTYRYMEEIMNSSPVTELTPQITFSLSLYTFGLGALVALLIIGFGLVLLRHRLRWWGRRPEDAEDILLTLMVKKLASEAFSKDLANLVLTWSATINADHLSRRNEFWVGYGQITVAVLLLTMITVLLLTKTIDPDAGLPILSGIAGFTIAKTTNSSRPSNLPRPGNEG